MRYPLLRSAPIAWVLALGPAHASPAEPPRPMSAPYLAAARRFADAVLEHGRDRYGNEKTPFFVDGLEAETLEPVRWMRGGETWILSNFASQQPLLRLLDGLTALTGERKYRDAAEDSTREALRRLRTPSGLLSWGGHLAWDLEGERSVGQYAGVHELKTHQPYYRLLWRVDPKAARELMEAVWAAHVLDWSTLDFNRHASTEKRSEPHWDAGFKDDIDVPFPTEGSNLSFVNVVPPLMHSGTMLSALGDHAGALTWTRRLVHRWQEGRDPSTGLCGGQLSYRRQDRAQEALGHVHPGINEAKIVASYHQTCRYHDLPLAQMQAGETLAAAGGRRAEVGREFILWASGDLEAYARECYDPKRGLFVAKIIDGTPIRWEESKSGYYIPQSFAPRKPDGTIFWGYAVAYRLTQRPSHWDMAREIARGLDLGDIGKPEGSDRELRVATSRAEWRCVYALLELHRATEDAALLGLACRVADNLVAAQAPSGLFPRAGRGYARTGDEIPLALLHVAAALEGRRSELPPPILDSRFFHCVYDGPLAEHQVKRADARTYDHLVFYGDS